MTVISFNEYSSYDGLALAGLVRRGDVSPEDLLETAMALTELINPEINALCQYFPDVAKQATMQGLPEGIFKGVPFLMKDIGAQMKGMPCSAGSRFLEGIIAPHDSELTRRFRETGSVIYGKTTTPELGLHITTESLLTGPTKNPWNTEYSTGGSSGGAAAAVAAGIVPFAHASDGLGSIRIPASCCHLFGLKIAPQRTPTGPDAGDISYGRAVEFIISRSVRDSAFMLDAVAGPDTGAPYWAPPPERSFSKELESDPKPLRIAMMEQTFSGMGIHQDCRAAVNHTSFLLESLGHHVEFAAPEFSWEEYNYALRVTGFSNLAAGFDMFGKILGRPPCEAKIEPLTWLSYLEGKSYTACDFHKSMKILAGIQRQIGKFFEQYDFLLSPVLSTPPFKLGDLMKPEDDLDLYWDRFSGDTYSPFTGPFNITGQPAASLPLYINEQGMPIGVQLVAKYGQEGPLLKLSAQLERVQHWSKQVPPIHASNL